MTGFGRSGRVRLQIARPLTRTLATTGIILMRVSMLGTNLGLGAATIPLAVGVVALLLDAGRLKSASG